MGEMLNQQAFADAFTTNRTPNHTHNGIDSPGINQVDILPNNKYRVGLNLSGGVTVDTLSTGILNPTSVRFFGIATDGSARLSLQGQAELGPGFDTDGVNIFPIGSIQGLSSAAVELASYVYNSGSTTRVGIAGTLAFGQNAVPEELVRITIQEYTNTSITFRSIVADGWTVTAALLIS